MKKLSGVLVIFCTLTEVWITVIYAFVKTQQMDTYDMCISLYVNVKFK